jgi:hypothetical protein
VGGSAVVNGGMDGCHDSIDLLQNLIVPESKDAISTGVQESGPDIIRGNPVEMLAAVNFNNNPFSVARKIHKIRTDRGLPAEMRGSIWKLPQMPPELSLGVRHGAAKLACFCDAPIDLGSRSIHGPPPHPLPAARSARGGREEQALSSPKAPRGRG